MYMFVFLEDIVYAWLWKKLKMKVSEKKNWKDNKNSKGQQLKGQKLKGFKMYVDMFQGLVTGLQKSQTTW